MKKPNFFIIGAPKCGTTSLARWLQNHPQVYFSPIKEPFFFSDDIQLRDMHGIKNLKQYEQLFSSVKSNHIAIGEGSTSYLFSETAVKNIIDYIGKPKLIVMLRNPIEMAVSLHSQQLKSLNEDVQDFEQAWMLQNERKKSLKIPKGCRDPKLLFYQEWCLLGSQMEKLYSKVDREYVKPILIDDLDSDPQGTYNSVLKFLGISQDYLPDFRVYNKRRRISRPTLHKLLLAGGHLKKRMGFRFRTGITRISTEPTEYYLISDRMRHDLLQAFRQDIFLLGELLGRDLSHWLG
jgi:hypothetical protein